MAGKQLLRPSRAIEHAWEEVTVGLRVPEGAPQRTFGWIATGYPTPPKRLMHLLTRYKEHAVPFEIDPSWVNLLPPTMVWAREDTEQMAPSLVQSIPLDAIPRIQRAMLLCGPTRADTPELQTLLLPEKKTVTTQVGDGRGARASRKMVKMFWPRLRAVSETVRVAA